MTDTWPLLYVGVYCDRCGIDRTADIRADTTEQAYAGLRALLNREGWSCDAGGDLCPECDAALRPQPNHQPRKEPNVMPLVSVTVPMCDTAGNVMTHIDVTGEQVTTHFAITPALTRRDDGTVGLADHGRALTHIPTGRTVTYDGAFVGLRVFAHALEELPIPWDTLDGFTREHAEQVRALHKKLWIDPTPSLPWPKWAGDESAPAVSLTGHLLDDYHERAHNRDEKRRELKDAIAAHDAELAERVGDLLLIGTAVEITNTYGLVYLLSVLHRVAPDDADRAARDLAMMWEHGDSAGDEFLHQWRQNLADGLPMKLPGGFPDLPAVTPAP